MSLPIAVFDTNILIEYTKNIPRSLQVIENCEERLISLITWIEFLTGFPEQQQGRPRAFLEGNFDIVAPDMDICDAVIVIRRERRLKLPDAMIYATAKVYGVPLVTLNTKDFNGSFENIIIPD